MINSTMLCIRLSNRFERAIELIEQLNLMQFIPFQWGERLIKLNSDLICVLNKLMLGMKYYYGKRTRHTELRHSVQIIRFIPSILS